LTKLREIGIKITGGGTIKFHKERREGNDRKVKMFFSNWLLGSGLSLEWKLETNVLELLWLKRLASIKTKTKRVLRPDTAAGKSPDEGPKIARSQFAEIAFALRLAF